MRKRGGNETEDLGITTSRNERSREPNYSLEYEKIDFIIIRESHIRTLHEREKEKTRGRQQEGEEWQGKE